METDYKKLLRISQVLNSTFGTDGPGFQHINGMNVRLDPIDSGLLRARCIMTVTYRSGKIMIARQRKHREDAIEMIKGALKRFKDDYEATFDEKINYEINDKAIEDSTEFVHVSQYSGVSRAFYRVSTLVKIK